MEGYQRSGNTLYYTYPNGKTYMIGQSKLLKNYDKIMSQFKKDSDQLEDWDYL